jgi:hypothetical protein
MPCKKHLSDNVIPRKKKKERMEASAWSHYTIFATGPLVPSHATEDGIHHDLLWMRLCRLPGVSRAVTLRLYKPQKASCPSYRNTAR